VRAWLGEPGTSPSLQRLMAVYAVAGVEARSSALPIDEIFAGSDFESRNDRYAAVMIEAATAAAREALALAGLDGTSIGLVTSVSCTGFMIPAVDAHVANALCLGPRLARLPITESTHRSNPFWPYAANKIACEERLEQAHRSEQFPVTIVRPSHTYDRTKLPTLGYYTAIARLRAGKPAVVHGDGTSLWVLTHHRDFAVGFVGLLGSPRAVGEAFHITSDELLTWNQIYTLLARAAGVEPNLVHVPSEIIARFDPELGAGLLGDKAHSVIFDNSKIRDFVPDFAPAIPFAAGAAEIMAWYDADPARQIINPELDRLMDALVAHMQAVTPH